MRVLHVVQKPQRRGAEIFAVHLSRALQAQSYEVRTVYLYSYQGQKRLSINRNDVILQGKERHVFERLPGVHPGLLRRLISRIRHFAPDVVQVNGGRTVKYGAFAKRLSTRQEWALIYQNIDNPYYWVRDPIRYLFYRALVIPQVDGVIGVSRTTLGNLRELYSLKVPCIYIPNGRDPAPFQRSCSQGESRRRMGIDPNASVMLFVGRLTTQKRPDRFLRILRQVREQRPDVEGWILGDGPLREELKAQAQRMAIQNAVRFLGAQEDVVPYIIASDLVALTSDSEGIPGVVLEAGFLGKPTVATRVGGMPECVLDGETGVLVHPRNEQGFAESVLALFSDPVRRAEMGDQAKQWVQENFAIDKVALQYLAFYQEVLARVRRTSA